jgi:hypothetical protein
MVALVLAFLLAVLFLQAGVLAQSKQLDLGWTYNGNDTSMD